MIKIFFSYTLRDENINKEFLLKLQNLVKSQGYDCYIDLLDNSYNEKGFQKKLVQMLKKSDIFCRIDSKEYLCSKWAKEELEKANLFGIKIVIVESSELINIVENKLNVAKIFD